MAGDPHVRRLDRAQPSQLLDIGVGEGVERGGRTGVGHVFDPIPGLRQRAEGTCALREPRSLLLNFSDHLASSCFKPTTHATIPARKSALSQDIVSAPMATE